ncbi:hypothetical protein K7432_003441 [Basidiobolus ranarum]|uniref:Uncharacterized protein n=1 Tax=Basidiobolus ranarum TaxID=34480 RepID=A0ABR2X012_9FUNG
MEGFAYPCREERPSSPSPSLTDTKSSTVSTSPLATPTPSRRFSCSSSTTTSTSPDFKYPRASPRSLRRFGFIDPPQRIPKPEPIERPVFKLSPQRPTPVKSTPKPRPEWNNNFNSIYCDKQPNLSGVGMSPRPRTPRSVSLDSTPLFTSSLEPKGVLKRKVSITSDSTGESEDAVQIEQLRRKITKLQDRVELEMEKRDTIERNLMIELASRQRFEAESRSKDVTIRELRIMLRQVSQNHENLVVTTDRRERDFDKRLKAEREFRVHLENQVKQLASMLAPDVMIRMLQEQIEVMDMHEDSIKPDFL